ncbi:MAG: diaminopimelate decarboxylase [Nitrospirales bacterium]|nr:diaminopimelate decarboxylase [Nitrospira sp.]MDR4500797.1 diaminopimelate decarboxylase [Nitrospirales bacterium]
MHDFHYQNNQLYCENVSIAEIAHKVGTPCYIYSHRTLIRHIRAFAQAFQSIPHTIAYAMKANSNLAILRLMAKEGSGVDIVSGGELFRALRAGVPSTKIVFAGVGKSGDEIEQALKADILMFNVESAAELQLINSVAGKLGVHARVALRINPDIDPKTHPYISTGLKKSKFGIGADRALEEFKTAEALPHIQVVGVHCHIGSQLTELTPFIDALKKILALIEALKVQGTDIRYLNIGGGLGITYSDEMPPHPKDLAEAISPLLANLKCQLIMEPGRSIVGNAGIMITRVLYNKATEAKQFVVVDAAMNDLLRPSLYEAYHEIQHVQKPAEERVKTVDIVGPICESGDFLAKERAISETKAGDLLAVMSAGAYGFTMASNYNSRPRTPEVLVKDDEIHIIRERERYDDLIRGEIIPDFLDSPA